MNRFKSVATSNLHEIQRSVEVMENAAASILRNIPAVAAARTAVTKKFQVTYQDVALGFLCLVCLFVCLFVCFADRFGGVRGHAPACLSLALDLDYFQTLILLFPGDCQERAADEDGA